MSGFKNFDKYIRQHLITIEQGYIFAKLYHIFSLDCPAIILGKDKIYGEVITFNDDEDNSVLKEIDALELFFGGSNQIEYGRFETDVFLNYKTLKLGVYYFINEKLFETLEKEYIPDGDWRKYKQLKK